MSYTSFSQNATRTQSSDTLICLPKNLVTFMVKDLVKFDGAQEEIQMLNKSMVYKDTYIQHQDSINQTLRSQLSTCRNSVDEYSQIDNINQKSIQSLTAKSNKYRRQRNALKFFVGALIVGLIVK